MKSPGFANPRTHQGFTLTEFMVSITIGLMIMGTLLTLYIGTSRSNREMSVTNGLIDNGRFALYLLENDIVHAGYWGTHVPQFDDQVQTSVPGDVPDAVPDPCLGWITNDSSSADYWSQAHQHNLLGIPVQSYDAASVCAYIVTNKLAGTDMLVVRHAETCVPGLGNCGSEVAGTLYFQASLCSTDAVPFVIGTSGHTLLQRDCTTVMEKQKFVSHLYYIRDYLETAGDGIPTLVRSHFECDFDLVTGACKAPSVLTPITHKEPEVLVEGIEGFRVELGVDAVSKTGAAVDYTSAVAWQDPANKTTPTNRGDSVPESFVRCTSISPCTAAQLMNVTVVNLHVLVRSRDTSTEYTDDKTYTMGSTTMGPFNDHYQRHVFSTTVRLNNVAFRRESP